MIDFLSVSWYFHTNVVDDILMRDENYVYQEKASLVSAPQELRTLPTHRALVPQNAPWLKEWGGWQIMKNQVNWPPLFSLTLISRLVLHMSEVFDLQQYFHLVLPDHLHQTVVIFTKNSSFGLISELQSCSLWCESQGSGCWPLTDFSQVKGCEPLTYVFTYLLFQTSLAN